MMGAMTSQSVHQIRKDLAVRGIDISVAAGDYYPIEAKMDAASCHKDFPLGNKAMDGLIGVVLKRLVGQVGKMSARSTRGPLSLSAAPAWNTPAGKGRVSDTIDGSLRANLKLVGNPCLSWRLAHSDSPHSLWQ